MIIILGGGNKEVVVYGNVPFFIPSIFSPILPLTFIIPLLLIIVFFIPLFLLSKASQFWQFKLSFLSHLFSHLISFSSFHFLTTFDFSISMFFFFLLWGEIIGRELEQEKEALKAILNHNEAFNVAQSYKEIFPDAAMVTQQCEETF